MAWSSSDESAKNLAEVTLIDEASTGAHFDDGDLRVQEEALRLLDPLTKDVLVRAFSRALLEGAGEVIEIGVRNLGQGGELKVVAEVGVDIFEHSAEARGREAAAMTFELLRECAIAFGDMG